MSDFRDFRYWGEDNAVTGAEYRDSDNNAIRLHSLDSSFGGWDSLVTAFSPAAQALGVTGAELVTALCVLDPPPPENLKAAPEE